MGYRGSKLGVNYIYISVHCPEFKQAEGRSRKALILKSHRENYNNSVDVQ
jgi:hypothetical protein